MGARIGRAHGRSGRGEGPGSRKRPLHRCGAARRRSPVPHEFFTANFCRAGGPTAGHGGRAGLRPAGGPPARRFCFGTTQQTRGRTPQTEGRPPIWGGAPARSATARRKEGGFPPDFLGGHDKPVLQLFQPIFFYGDLSPSIYKVSRKRPPFTNCFLGLCSGIYTAEGR